MTPVLYSPFYILAPTSVARATERPLSADRSVLSAQCPVPCSKGRHVLSQEAATEVQVVEGDENSTWEDGKAASRRQKGGRATEEGKGGKRKPERETERQRQQGRAREAETGAEADRTEADREATRSLGCRVQGVGYRV